MTGQTDQHLSLNDVLIIDADIHAHKTPAAILPFGEGPAMEIDHVR